MKIFSLLLALWMSFYVVRAQKTLSQISAYNPQELYLPDFAPTTSNEFRSANGTPGPKYWQNRADYLIHATLSEKDTSITGDVTITYTNNSPDKLDFLWLQLDQNLFDPTSRGLAATPVSGDRFDVQGFKFGGYHIGDVSIIYHEATYKINPQISDTRMQIRLKNPMLPKGDIISIRIKYNFSIPAYGADRMGRMNTKNGEIYEVAQWYPRMCVYDDEEGWNTLPYMGLGEFYCEYGNIDYYVSAPSELIVYGSGDLLNPSEVLTPEEIKRLALAALSDKPVTIINESEVGKPEMRPGVKGNLTWHFAMKNTRDVAWAASKALVWDAARINLPSGRKAMAMSAYPPENMGDTAWTRATEYLKTSIEIYSKEFFEYPWNNAANIGALVTGMEYPGMIFCDHKEKKAGLWLLIAHEIGHNWFPMIVGSNERKYMWLDEGVNTYINRYASEIFNHGEYENDTSLLRYGFYTLDVNVLASHHYPLMTPPEAMDMNQFFDYYSKTSFGLNLLRKVVVGKERFDYAFRGYTKAWAFKHPTPNDFFHFINNAAGEDLNWFWKEWFYTTWTLDQAITDVHYIDNDPSNGALITVENKNKLIMPVMLKIIQKNGETGEVQLPMEIWERGSPWTFKYASVSKIESIILDPDHVLPDIDRKNNEWKDHN